MSDPVRPVRGGNLGRSLLIVLGILVLIAAVFLLIIWLAGGDDHGTQNTAEVIATALTAVVAGFR